MFTMLVPEPVVWLSWLFLVVETLLYVLYVKFASGPCTYLLRWSLLYTAAPPSPLCRDFK